MSYAQLAGHAAALAADYFDDEELWEGSPFAWIKALPSRTKGAVGVRLAQACPADSGVRADRVGSGMRVGNRKIVSRHSME